MEVKVQTSNKISGKVKSPPSKSYAHRQIIGAYLSKTPTTLIGAGCSQDVLATLNCLKEVGLNYEYIGDDVKLSFNSFSQNKLLNCNESGSTLRFLLPVISALGINATFTGSSRLLERPIKNLVDCLNANGANISGYTINGKLKSGDYNIAGNVSSQYITGLLFALPLLDGDSKIIINEQMVSKGYVDITIDVLKSFNIVVEEKDYGYFVKGNQKYQSKEQIIVEGDYSGSAFTLCLGALGDGVEVTNLNKNSCQGDKEILNVLKKFGAIVESTKSGYFVKKGNLTGQVIDCENIPDLVQIISVLASYSKGKTILKNVSRLKIKESDRIESILTNLKVAGIDAKCNGSDLIINGGSPKSGKFLGFNDHRSVMSAVCLATFASGESIVTDSLAINKSYTNFYKDYVSLGGKVNGDI